MTDTLLKFAAASCYATRVVCTHRTTSLSQSHTRTTMQDPKPVYDTMDHLLLLACCRELPPYFDYSLCNAVQDVFV